MRQVGPTRNQWVMIVCIVIAALALAVFAVYELAGVFNPETEDTFTEWVSDLSLRWVLLIGSVFTTIGIVAIWSFGHFLEWWARRKPKGYSGPEL